MTLASDKETQIGPSSISTPESPKTLRSQNLGNSQKLLDKTGKGGKGFSKTAEEEINHPNAQNLGKRKVDAPGEKGTHTDSTGSLTALKATVMNGAVEPRQHTCTGGPDQTRLSAPQREFPSAIDQVLDDSSSTTQSVDSNSRTESAHEPTSSLTLSSSASKQPYTNGSSTPVSLNVAVSATSGSSNPPLPVPSPSSLSKDTPISLPVDAYNERGCHDTSDETEHLSRRTRSRQKRSPESLSKEPAKRARALPNTAMASEQPISKLETNSKAKFSDNGDIDMHDPPSIPLDHPMANDTDTTDATPSSNEDCSQPPTTETPTSEPQSTTPLLQAAGANLESNLDPALSRETNANPHVSSNKGSVNYTAAEDTVATLSSLTTLSSSVPLSTPASQAKPNSPPSTSSVANNPYLGLSTAFLKGSVGSGGTGFNPYALYYGPGTPITPHTPAYPYPYIYHLPGPITPQTMYPANPGFPSSPATQKSPSVPSLGNGEPQRQKPKRLKAHTVTSGNHNIPIVPRDKKGNPMLPLNVGIMTVISLGEVCTREHFHTERYIFPVGYEVTRRYLSTVDPTMEVVYHCTILDGGDGPKFQIVPSDAPDRTVIAGTATGAWSSIVKQANAIRSRQHSNSVSGPDFFGLGQNTIKHLIQELPNADRLRDYVWQNFTEGGPLGGRHAAVTPALPEDYDSTLPIGALYPSERDRMKREINLSPRGLNHYPQHIIAQAEAQRKQHSAVQNNQKRPVLATSTGLPAPTVSSVNGQSSNQSPSSSTTQPLPQNPPSTTDNTPDPQPPPTSVPTTLAGIMSAYPVPTHASASSSARVTALTPPSTSSASS